MDQRTIFLAVVLSFLIGYQSVEAQTTTMFQEEKISLGLGIGVQYSFVGFQGKYFFSKYVGAVASGTYSPFGILWNVGAELRVPEPLPRRISPYFNVLVGTNSFSDLSSVFFGTGGGFFEFIEEKKSFIGITIGTGIKWDVFNNNSNYLRLGFDILFINKSYAEFVDQFNGTYATSYSTETPRFLPSIGYVFCLSRKSKRK